MFKTKIKQHDAIIIPKSNADGIAYANKPNINKHNQHYENIRSIVQNENENIKISNEKQNKQKLNIV